MKIINELKFTNNFYQLIFIKVLKLETIFINFNSKIKIFLFRYYFLKKKNHPSIYIKV